MAGLLKDEGAEEPDNQCVTESETRHSEDRDVTPVGLAWPDEALWWGGLEDDSSEKADGHEQGILVEETATVLATPYGGE